MTRLTRAGLFDRTRLGNINPRNNQSLARFQDALSHGKALLAEYHLEGGNAAILGKHQSWLIDQLLVSAWTAFATDETGRNAPSLIAAGGYGRQELNLESDIDLLVLLPSAPGKTESELIESFVRFCWDMGLKVGHSARSLKQCIDIAAKDLTVITNLMETRLVDGDPALFDLFQEKLRARSLWPADRYFKAKLAEQKARHLHYGDTAYNLEPNLKESPGGLRDLHMISWVANRYFGTSDFAELVEHGYLTRTEYRGLIRGRDFLWRLRNGLHLITRRCEDRLLLDFQRELAEQLGYSQRKGVLAVEQMMQQYYRTVQEIQLLNEIALQHFEEDILNRRRPRPKKISEHFNVVGNNLETSHESLFQENPGAILEMFLVMQKNPKVKGVRASTIRQLRENLKLIDNDFRRDPANRATFLEIFRYQEGLTHGLRRMNAYGVLGRFFPEFGKIVGQMQHDLFHIYTVDAHSLFVVRNLRRLMVPEHRDEFPVLTNILSKLNSRERLYLAALCHDIGKGSGRDHSEVGEEITLALCRRLDMSEYDTNFVAWLVRNHLIMSWTAQKEDISDPRVIDKFAEKVGDQEHLDNLYLLTVADIRGTSPKVWNEWKGQLLDNLHNATSRRLRSGISGAEAIAERIEARKNAIRKIVGRSIPAATLDQLWDQMDEEYFLRNGPETSAWHATQICNASLADLPLVSIRYRKEINAQQILVVAPESYLLLMRSTAAIDSLGLSIMDARVHLTRSGMSILVFIVSAEDTVGDAAMAQQTSTLRDFLLNPPAKYRPVSRNLPRVMKQFQVPTVVTFADNEQLGHTTMEVISQDRPGLLYLVSMALVECRIKLKSAKISTVGEKAEDTFLITDRDGNPVSDPAQKKRLETLIKSYLEQNA